MVIFLIFVLNTGGITPPPLSLPLSFLQEVNKANTTIAGAKNLIILVILFSWNLVSKDTLPVIAIFYPKQDNNYLLTSPYVLIQILPYELI